MDVSTSLAILGGAIGSKSVVEKILGPTADYLGNGLRYHAQKGVENIARIFKCAEVKLGDKLDEPGVVPPRVLKGILAEGAFVDDALAAEYFGGVLASSRSDNPGDDRAVGSLAQIARMSSYQLRAHFVMYAAMGDLYVSHNLKYLGGNDLERMETFFPIGGFLRAMGLPDNDEHDSIFSHALIGLERESLIGPEYIVGTVDEIREYCGRYPDSDGLVIWPTYAGCELILWACGNGTNTSKSAFPDEATGRWLTGMEPMQGATPTKLLPKSKGE